MGDSGLPGTRRLTVLTARVAGAGVDEGSKLVLESIEDIEGEEVGAVPTRRELRLSPNPNSLGPGPLTATCAGAPSSASEMGDDLREVLGMANFSSLSNVNLSLLLGRLDGAKGAAKGGMSNNFLNFRPLVPLSRFRRVGGGRVVRTSGRHSDPSVFSVVSPQILRKL